MRRGPQLILIELLVGAGRWSAMPAGEQVRFENTLDQMAGRTPRKDPLPLPPEMRP